jgi:hypothetical protein
MNWRGEGVFSRYAIGGAMAATFYAEPVLTFVSLAPIYEALRQRGYKEEKECVQIEGVPVQFLPAYNALIEEALAQAREIDYEGVSTSVVRAEYLIAICLQTGRAKDRARVAMLREQAHLDHELLADILNRHQLEETWKLWHGISAEVARIFTAKQKRRHDLARLPCPEKVRAIIQLQGIAATILRARGKIVKPWSANRTGV